MKDQLLKLYQERYKAMKQVSLDFPKAEVDMAGPLLMSPNALFPLQSNSLLIIGQETKGWTYDVDDLEKQMNTYEEFNVGKKYYKSPFWNVTRKVEKALGNQQHSCAWTNISKYDLNGGRSYGKYERSIATIDDILVDEINILKPKVCLFFTGPNFDYRLNKVFNRVEYEKIPDWDIRKFCKLKHPNLPDNTFRTYHPRFLRVSGLEDNFVEYFTGIAKN